MKPLTHTSSGQYTHNPHCKLVAQDFVTHRHWVMLVAYQDNDGKNKGLEVYHYDSPQMLVHYKSYNYPEGKIPKLYKGWYEKLIARMPEVNPGHKLKI